MTATKTGGLTVREAQVLALLVEGLSNTEIGAAMWLSRRTVQTHVAAILRKLAARNRTHAAALAVRNRVLDDDKGGSAVPNTPAAEPVNSIDHGQPLRPVIVLVDEVWQITSAPASDPMDADVAALADLIRSRTADLAAAARRCAIAAPATTPDCDLATKEDRRG